MNTSDYRDTLELARISRALTRSLPGALVLAALAGAGTYAVFERQTKWYEANAQLLSAGSGSNPALSETRVTLSQLPLEAFQGALNNPDVQRNLLDRLSDSSVLTTTQKRRAVSELEQVGTNNLVAITAPYGKPDYATDGYYNLSARFTDPTVAAEVANAAVASLISWDVARGVRSVNALQVDLRRQLSQIDRQLGSPTLDASERTSLLKLRDDRREQLSRARLLSNTDAVQGTLSVVAPAAAPSSPVAPRPARNAGLAALLTLFGVLLLGVLRSSYRRSVDTVADVRALGLPVIGTLPRFRRLTAEHRAMGLLDGRADVRLRFIQANLDLDPDPRRPRVVLITAPNGGEGSTSVTLGLARSFAYSGQRTLLVSYDDAFMKRKRFRPSVLTGFVNRGETHSQPTPVETNLDSVTVDSRGDGSLYLPMSKLLAHVKAQYDVVLIDAQAVLVNVDTVRTVPLTTGVVLVAEAGATSQQSMTEALHALSIANARVLGVILNRSNSTSSRLSLAAERPEVASSTALSDPQVTSTQ